MSFDLIPSFQSDNNEQTKGVSFYPLPSSDDYEKFLQKIKKDQCMHNNYSRFSNPVFIDLLTIFKTELYQHSNGLHRIENPTKERNQIASKSPHGRSFQGY